jgi:DNA-binding beta-propeller fold protein YncE
MNILLQCNSFCRQCDVIVNIIYTFIKNPRCNGMYIKSVPSQPEQNYNMYCTASKFSKRIYVSDSKNNFVRIVSCNGIVLKTFGSKGKRDGQFDRIEQITIYKKELFIVDCNNVRIQVFDLNGTFIRKINLKKCFQMISGIALVNGYIYISNPIDQKICTLNINGKILHSCNCMNFGLNGIQCNMTLASNGNLIVSDIIHRKVVMLSSKNWKLHHATQKITQCENSCILIDYSVSYQPAQIAVSEWEELYVVDKNDSKIYVYSLSGKLIRSFGNQRQLTLPTGIVFTTEGHVLIYDSRGAHLFY